MFGECHTPCSFKTSFVDFEKEKVKVALNTITITDIQEVID
jgi:hypothetical protein